MAMQSELGDWALAELVACIVTLPVNFFLTFAMLKYRSKLRTQAVNLLAANVVVACFVHNFLRLFDAALVFSKLFCEPSQEKVVLCRLQHLQKATMFATCTAIAGGLAFVALGLQEGILRVNKTVADFEQQNYVVGPALKRFWSYLMRHRKRTTYAAAVLSWFVPVVFSVASAATGSCIYGNDTRSGNTTVMWPMNDEQIKAGSVIWFAYIVLLAPIAVTSFGLFKRGDDIVMSYQSGRTEPGSSQSSFDTELQTDAPQQSTLRVVQSRSLPSLLLLNNLRRHLVVVFCVTIAYALSTGFVLVLLVSPKLNKESLYVPAILLSTLLETLATVGLCFQLPGLNIAVQSMF